MFVITGVKNDKFIVLDTDDSSKECASSRELIHYVKDLNLQIKGVYPNGVVCIWSELADKLASLEDGTPLVISYKNVGSSVHALYAGFNVEKCGFCFIDESSMFVLTSRFLREHELSRTLDISFTIEPTEVAKIMKNIKQK